MLIQIVTDDRVRKRQSDRLLGYGLDEITWRKRHERAGRRDWVRCGERKAYGRENTGPESKSDH